MAKNATDLTPTELFAQDNYGVQPEPSVEDRFRDLIKKSYGAQKQAVSNEADAASSIVDRLKQYRAENPMGQWGQDTALRLGMPAADAARTGYGMAQWLSKETSAPVAPGAQPTPPQPPQPAADGGPPVTPGIDVHSLPDAAPMQPKMSAGMGPGGDVYDGYGTEKGLLHAKEDVLAGAQNQVDIKGDEYAARLKAMDTHADLTHELAAQQAYAGQAYQKAVDQEDARQQDQETKIQQATDETAARGLDPGRYFRNRDVGFWITMAVGAVASGMLSALNGGHGQNPFMDSVRAMAHEDLDAQEKAIDQGWKRVKGMETAYERMRMSGVDRVNATQKAYDTHLQALQTEIQSRMEKAQLPAEKANFQAALNAVQQERNGVAVQMQEYYKNIRDGKARAAAAAANAQYARRRQEQLDSVEMDLKRSQIYKNKAEADKTKNEVQKPDKEAEKDAKVESAIDEVGRRGMALRPSYLNAAIGTGAIAQRLAPSHALAEQDRQYFNETFLPSVFRASGDRMQEDQLLHIINSVRIPPGADDKMVERKVREAQDALRSVAAMREKGVGSTSVENIPSFKKGE